MRTLALLSLSLILLAGCSPAKSEVKAEPYADLKAVYLQVTDAQDQLSAGLAAAKDAAKVAQVLKTYTAKMREIGPSLKAAQAQYPDLAQASTPPAELASSVKAMNDSTGTMMGNLSKVQQYLEDPAVVAAMDELSAAARE